MNSSRAGNVNRRALLSGAALDVLFLVVPMWPAEARGLDLARFLRLSEKLTRHTNLPPEVAAHYLRSIAGPTGAFKQNGKVMTADTRAALDSRIVADWYSGQTTTSTGIACVDYTGALMWEAIGFAKPRGAPDAEAGRWALAPF